jgi:hypothetical protein
MTTVSVLDVYYAPQPGVQWFLMHIVYWDYYTVCICLVCVYKENNIECM